jgi:hypothetical protein
MSASVSYEPTEMNDSRTALVAALEQELSRAAPPQALDVSAEVRRRHGSAVAAVVFYGSCLRKQRADEGVLDFYALVHGYGDAYRSNLLAWSNAALPPNVFYAELARPRGVIRTKYAVMSLDDFARGCRPESLHSIVWARFCQPALLVWSESQAVAAHVAELAAEATLTMVLRGAALLADTEGRATFRVEALWQRGFEETYRTELRTERPETIASIYRSAPERYERMTMLALRVLHDEGVLALESDGTTHRVQMPPALRRRLVVGWKRRRPVAKSLYAVRLVKSAVTFGDWLPYAIWKLNRHTGVRIEPTDRQRRHPLVYGWPVILRLLRQQKLR